MFHVMKILAPTVAGIPGASPDSEWISFMRA